MRGKATSLTLLFTAAITFLGPTQSIAGASDPAEQYNEALEQLKELERMAGQRAIRKEADCFNALAHRAFCACVRERTPVGLTFIQYVAVLTFPKMKVLEYLSDAEYQRMVVGARKARRECAETLKPQ